MNNETPYIVLPVNASAYRKGDARGFLTHAVDANWSPLCDRVKADSILDDAEMATGLPPTCPHCLRAVAAL